MNYFEFYDMPVSFHVDEERVKKKYFETSRKFHPDFYITQPAAKQDEVLELSTFNTKAFQTLSDFDSRMKYILELKNRIQEGERYELPPDFLMEMMELNEGLMEMKMEPDQEKILNFGLKILDLKKTIFENVRSIIENYDDAKAGEHELNAIKDYYYKKKYLLRISESLDNFGDS